MIYQQIHSLSNDYFTVDMQKDLSFPLHMHSCFEVVAVTSGEMTVQIDGKNYYLKTGDIIFIFPYQIHSILTTTSSSDTLCIFSSKMVAHFYNKTKGGIPENPVINLKDNPIFLIFSHISDSDTITRIKGIMYLLCDELTKNTELVSKNNFKHTQLELLDKIFSFANDNFSNNSTLKDVSKALKYDYSYISKIFSAFVGMSFNRYINSLRIFEACYMLKNTDNTIVSISEQCGFSSLRSFNRNFLQITSMTPSEYRNSKF